MTSHAYEADPSGILFPVKICGVPDIVKEVILYFEENGEHWNHTIGQLKRCLLEHEGIGAILLKQPPPSTYELRVFPSERAPFIPPEADLARDHIEEDVQGLELHIVRANNCGMMFDNDSSRDNEEHK